MKRAVETSVAPAIVTAKSIRAGGTITKAILSSKSMNWKLCNPQTDDTAIYPIRFYLIIKFITLMCLDRFEQLKQHSLCKVRTVMYWKLIMIDHIDLIHACLAGCVHISLKYIYKLQISFADNLTIILASD